jgi:predicted Zn-dependent protease
MTQVFTQIDANALDAELQKILAQARSTCEIDGKASDACAAAWDAVEELQAAIADRKQAKHRTSLDIYCETHPDASECRVYDV